MSLLSLVTLELSLLLHKCDGVCVEHSYYLTPAKCRTYVEGGQGFTHALLDEVVCDAAGRMFIKDRVHQRDLSRTASRLGLRRAELSG